MSKQIQVDIHIADSIGLIIYHRVSPRPRINPCGCTCHARFVATISFVLQFMIMFESVLGTLQTYIAKNEGLLLVVAAEAFFALMNVSVKLLGTDVSVLEIVWIRMIITYACSVAYLYYANINDPVLGPPGVRVLLCFRGLAGFFGIFGLYYSLQYLSLSDAIVLTFLTPLCTAIVGSVLLKEKFTAREALAGAISLAGVILIAQPPFLFGAMGHRVAEKELRSIEIENEAKVTTAQRMVAVGVALIGVAGVTCEYTLIRTIGKRAHALHNIVYLSVFCVIASSVGMIATRTSIVIPTRWSFIGMLLLVGVFGLCAQTLMTMGFQREAIGRASVGVYTGIIFALILGRIVFGTLPSLLSVLGTVLILGSALYVAVMKNSETEVGVEGNTKVKEGEGGDVEVGLLEMDVVSEEP